MHMDGALEPIFKMESVQTKYPTMGIDRSLFKRARALIPLYHWKAPVVLYSTLASPHMLSSFGVMGGNNGGAKLSILGSEIVSVHKPVSRLVTIKSQTLYSDEGETIYVYAHKDR